MYIHLNCQACKQRLRVSAVHAGKRVRCPVCKDVSAIPAKTIDKAPVDTPGEVAIEPSSAAAQRSTKDQTYEGEYIDELGTPPDMESEEEVGQPPVGFDLAIDQAAAIATISLRRAHGLLLNEGQLRDQLIKQRVHYGVDADQIKMAFLHLDYPDQAEIGRSFIVAQGSAAVPGVDGRLEFAVDVTGEAKVDEQENEGKGRVDFKNMARITTVKAGQLLATVIPPTRGTKGVGLDGAAIESTPSLAAEYMLGEGVTIGEGRREIRALIDGRPLWHNATLSVVQIYEIPGNVDLSTGNVLFDGHVIVRGAVLDEFEIRCKSLEVDGTVGSAIVVTTQDATFKGGVNGHHKGRLDVGGNCIAKYLNEVEAVVSGDLNVERGITNCEIGVLGELVAERIVGGNSSALLGFEVNYLGSDLGVVTTVSPGLDYRLSRAEGVLVSLEDEIEELGKKAAPYLAQGAEFERLDEEKQEAAESAFESLTEARQKRTQLVETIEVTKAAQAESAIAMVNIGSQLHADVVVTIEESSREFTEAKGGKWSIGVDSESGQIDIDKYRRRPIRRGQ